MNPAHRFARLLPAILALTVATKLVGAETPVSNVPLLTALSDAHSLADGRSDLKVLRVEGSSMSPFFGSGAVLVIKQIASAKLHPGMVVVYTNRFNETVAHRITGLAKGEGWTVQGYNNGKADSTPVTEANLIGVVYATFHSDAQPVESGMLVSVNQGTPVALAAPAR